MSFDLQTILVLRLCIDLVVAGALAVQARRHPSVGGPGWWAIAMLLSTLGSLGLGLRLYSVNIVTVSVASTLLGAAGVFAWLGLRSHLELPRSLRWAAGGVLALLLANVLFYVVWDSAQARQTLFVLTGVAIRIGMLRDMRLHDPQRRQPVLQALCWLTRVELVLLVLVGVMVWFRQDVAVGIGAMVPALLVFFMFDVLLRMAICFALVSARLQQTSDRAHEMVLAREAESRALVDNLGAGVMVFRPDRSLQTINAAARRFVGWGCGDTQAAPPEPLAPDWRLLAEDGRPLARHEVPFEQVLATGRPVNDVVLGTQTATGDTVRWGLCNAYPENDAQGRLRHVVVTFVDITSLRQAQLQQQLLEQALAQSQKMKALGTLAGGVAHDFNNILAAILGNAELARQDVPPDSPAQESLDEISSAARRGRELVRQVLAFSRKQPLARTPVPLDEVMTAMARLLRTLITPQIQLEIDVPSPSPVILADATQLGQVLLNLGTNAIHAMEGRPGRIVCRVEALARDDARLPPEVARHCAQAGVDAVCVSVSDNGSGMCDATQKRMFEPFFTTKIVGQGTGLGLPVVLGIVQAHGGAIEVDSAPGQGTRFRLYFPAAAAAAAVTVPAIGRSENGTDAVPGTMYPSATTAPLTTAPATEESPAMDEQATSPQRHILYLDDDDTLVFLVRRLLERRGYKVTAVTDQEEAIAAVRNQPDGFDLVMTDFNMPGMSGLDVARAVLAINPDLPVAVASGYISDELETQAREVGVREVVFKTDAVDAFCEVVARLVSPPRPA